ncbi:MAG: PDZ domain-containing protein [Pirellulales bacterium]
MLIQRSRLVTLLLATAAIVVSKSSSSLAQPVFPPAAAKPEEGERPAPPEADREPGYLGLMGDDRHDEGAGVLIVRVVEGTPAAEAGLAVDDLIVAIDGQKVGSLDAMAAQLQPHAAGKKVRFEIRRGDTLEKIEVTLGRRPPRGERPFEFGRIPQSGAASNRVAPPAEAVPRPATGPTPPDPAVMRTPRGQLLGIRTGVVTEEARQRLRLPQAAGARVVSRVVGSPADQAGIPLEAVIVAVDDQPVTKPIDLAQLIEAAGPGKEVELTYYGGGERRMRRVRLANIESRPSAEEGPQVDPRTVARPFGQQQSPADAAERIEQLERRLRELEQRVKELERAISAPPTEPPAAAR